MKYWYIVLNDKTQAVVNSNNRAESLSYKTLILLLFTTVVFGTYGIMRLYRSVES